MSNEKPTSSGKPTETAKPKFVSRIIDRTSEGGCVAIVGTTPDGDFVKKLREAAAKPRPA